MQLQKNMKKLRLKDYDYTTNGHYFVTICTNYQKPFLTERDRNVVARFIEQTHEIPGVAIDYYIIMPTHLHLILILDNCKFKLGEIIRRFKAKTSKEIGIGLWQPNYYEHVIRNEKALKKIREYIINNPAAQKIKIECFYPPDKSPQRHCSTKQAGDYNKFPSPLSSPPRGRGMGCEVTRSIGCSNVVARFIGLHDKSCNYNDI